MPTKALVFAGLFFNGKESNRWYQIGQKIIDKELLEQVLNDGGNFELSPMYHSIFLEDLLDLVNIHHIYDKINWMDCDITDPISVEKLTPYWVEIEDYEVYVEVKYGGKFKGAFDFTSYPFEANFFIAEIVFLLGSVPPIHNSSSSSHRGIVKVSSKSNVTSFAINLYQHL